MGDVRDKVDVGGIRPGLLGDSAWIDENANGLQDYGEAPLPGVTLTLYALEEGGEREIGTAETDEYGLYRFERLRPGRYRLGAILPEGYSFTINRPDLSEIDSDFPTQAAPTGTTAEFILRSGQARRDMDIGASQAQ
jgi:hypothetical protein